MKITCVGGGPAGLMLAILTGQAGHDVTVIERQRPAESFGWGVVFWDNLLRQLDHHDPPTAALVREHAYTWHDQVVVVDGAEPVAIPSHGYSLRRRLLLELLRRRAAECGVRIEERPFTGRPTELSGSDLVVAADGVNSRLRREETGFGTEIDQRRNYYLWLGTEREFDSFTFPFVRRPEGWLWAHAYGFDRGASTFVVELAPQTWKALGFDRLGPETSLRMLEDFFAGSLRGHRLHPQAGTRDRLPWTRFSVVRNRRWYVRNLVLLGDAAHTTHFTIGSGTRLAMEDSIALAEALATEPAVPVALARYERIRQEAIRTVQREATRSAIWFEQVPRFIGQPPQTFAWQLDNRRSPVMPLLPVPLYRALTGAAERTPAIAAPLRRFVSRF